MLWSHQAARAKTLPFRLAYHFVMPFGRSLIPKERSALLIMSSRPAIIATHLLWARHRSRDDRRGRIGAPGPPGPPGPPPVGPAAALAAVAMVVAACCATADCAVFVTARMPK